MAIRKSQPLPGGEAFDAARRRNERWLAGYMVTVSALFGGPAAARLVGGGSPLDRAVFVVCLIYGLYYATVWRKNAPPDLLQMLLRCTL